MENDNKREKAIIQDIINALGLYKANQAGVYGNKSTTPEKIGTLAGFMTDFTKAVSDFMLGKTSGEELKEVTKITLKATGKAIVGAAVEFVSREIKTMQPLLTPIVDTVKDVVKGGLGKVVEKAADKIVEVGAKMLSKLTSFFA